MRRAFLHVLSLFLYHLGDLISRPMNHFDFMANLYPLYNRIMGWSVALDRDARIWKKPRQLDGDLV